MPLHCQAGDQQKMSEHQRFHLHSLEELRAELRRLHLTLPISERISILGDPVPLGTLSAPNRFAVQPMEGFDATADGGPGELTFRRYRRYAEGGSGLLWFEATAVAPDARSNPQQLYLHEGNVSAFRRLTDQTRMAARAAFGREPVLVIQLTHSGRYSKPDGVPRPIIAHHSPILDPRHGLPPDYPLISDDELDRLQDVYVRAARLAAQAGFDGVDVKSCHRYLVSELLASFTRAGRYGGAFENRSRFLIETLGRIRNEVPSVFVTTRMNAFDAIPHPFGFGVTPGDPQRPDLDEPTRLARLVCEIGAPLLNVSIGNPYFNPHYGRPFDFPIKGMTVPAEHPLEAIARFASITRTLQQAVSPIPVVAGGYAWLRHLMPYVAAGLVEEGWAALIGQGRGAFAYPDSVRDILTKGRMDPDRCCVTCSACTQIMRDGGMTGCVVRDSAIYGPQYREARRHAMDRLTEEARRCRDCENPTCAKACPAHVDVPGFVRAFGDGRYRDAYDLLRRTNALPEMCAFVCPSEVQCEGGCVEHIFCEHPIPIRDIQLEVCRIARREGWTGIRLPAESRPGRIAVVGAGPAGLACAIRLLELGHKVEIFEHCSRLGGTPDAMIPTERMGDAETEIHAILAPALKNGRLAIHTPAGLGSDLPLKDLRSRFDAIFLAMGLQGSASLGKADGVVDALIFLREAKAGRQKTVPDRVAVIGGGNTAMDAAVVARRLGAADVFLIYRRSFTEMPAWPSERDRALHAGVHMLILTQPLGYDVDAAGRLLGVRIVRTDLGPPDEQGRRRPVPRPDSETVLPVGLAIEAIGQTLSPETRAALEGLALTEDGLVKVKAGSQETSLDGVYAGGDMVNGGSTAVQGIHEGMRAAEEIAARLAQAAAISRKGGST